MSTYIIANFTIIDQEKYNDYAGKTRTTLGSLIQAGNAKVLIMADGDNLGTKEGKPANKIVVLEFTNREIAETWYNSSDYQALIPLRQAATENSWVTLTDKISPPN